MAADQPEEAVRAGVEHLQAAAREMIAATRSLLDAAEELIDDPKAVQSLAGMVGGLATAAAARLRSDAARSETADDAGSDDREGGVERIRLS